MDILIFSLFIVIFGVLPGIWFFRRKEKNLSTKPSVVLIILTILVLSINTYLSYILGKASISYIIGNVYILPIIMITIFMIFKSSRNTASIFRITFFTSLLVFVGQLGNILSALSSTPIN